MAKWRNPGDHQARTESYAKGNITHPSEPMKQMQPTTPDYHMPHEGEPSQTDICNDGDGVPDWRLVHRLIEDRYSARDEIQKLALEKEYADAKIHNLVEELDSTNERHTELSKKNEVLRDLVKKLKWPSSENRVGRETKQQINKLQRELKEVKAQLSYQLEHPYSNHVQDLQEVEQRLLLATSKLRVLERYLYGQTPETNQQQSTNVKGVRQRSNSF
ncbi:hypothetical protein DER45DRAFT_545267 [Fusarium avenaceum]|nr:hypothetical protein DER45DRAFT_545267 [Fusarium avenaceum]